MIAADGRIVWLRDIVSVRKAPDGRTRLVGIALDITSEKKDEADKRADVASCTQALIENSSDNISLLRHDGVDRVSERTRCPASSDTRRTSWSAATTSTWLHPDDVGGDGRRVQSDVRVGTRRSGRCATGSATRMGAGTASNRSRSLSTAPTGPMFAVVNTRDVTEMVGGAAAARGHAAAAGARR